MSDKPAMIHLINALLGDDEVKIYRVWDLSRIDIIYRGAQYAITILSQDNRLMVEIKDGGTLSSASDEVRNHIKGLHYNHLIKIIKEFQK